MDERGYISDPAIEVSGYLGVPEGILLEVVPILQKSVEPAGFTQLVGAVRKIEIALGDGIKKIQNGEYFNINLQRKCLYVNKDIPKGKIITKDDLIIKGPGGGILPKYIDLVVGRKLTEDILNDYPVTWNQI